MRTRSESVSATDSDSLVLPSTRHRPAVFLVLLLSLGACSTLSYYTQSVSGHLELLLKRRPIDQITADPSVPTELKQRLETVKRIRQFATEELGLPENDSYLSYADLQRNYVVWSVFATPEFSLDPLKWCFPFVGCVSYRGYFNIDRAGEFANELHHQGHDVYMGGVSAYSTLGWFNDPVLNTMMNWDETKLAELIFHELAHQKLYIKNDTDFNEAFATKVAETGVRRWLQRENQPALAEQYDAAEKRSNQFVELVLATKTALETLYSSQLGKKQMRSEKERTFSEMRENYAAFKQRWDDYNGYDKWMASHLNNAKISSIVTYHYRAEAFDALLNFTDSDLNKFYALVERIGALPSTRRDQCLDGLIAHGAGFTHSCFDLAPE